MASCLQQRSTTFLFSMLSFSLQKNIIGLSFFFSPFAFSILFFSFPFPFLFPFSTVDLGAAYGTAKSGVGISSMGVMNPQLVMRNIIPVVMAGVLGIYGLIVAVILIQNGTSYLCCRCVCVFCLV